MNVIEVRDLSKKFKAVQAVDHIDFNVKEGEILGLLGPNGAGKSTTISMISTLLKPDAGYITYRGQDIAKKPKVIQQNLGYVPQEIGLYPMLSGKENMYFWGRAYGLKGQALKDAVERVSEIIGIKDRLKDTVKTYSGGMQRRLNIGVALLHSPDIIIMDEPTVGIDPQSRKHILDTVLKLNQQGKTVIYTSHYMEEVEYLCHRICIMDQGKIIAEGTKEELIDKIAVYRELLIKLDHNEPKLKLALEGIDSVIEVIDKENQILLHYIKEPQIFKKVMDIISDFKVNVVSIDVQEPDLETVFLKLTGRELRD